MRRNRCFVVVTLVLFALPVVAEPKPNDRPPNDRSPVDLVVAADSRTVYISDRTAGCVVVVDLESQHTIGEIPLRGKPQGLALSESGDTLYVSEHGAGTVAVIDVTTHQVSSRIEVGKWPTDVALLPSRNRLYVTNQDNHRVSIVELDTAPATPSSEVAAIREPYRVAVAPNQKQVVVVNQLPLGAGTDHDLAAEVSIVNVDGDADEANVVHVKLPAGSSSAKGICVSPDSQWAYVVHNLGRFNLPVTQLERGWVNTTALSIIDIAAAKRKVTVLLDDLMQGAPDPDSVVVSEDGSQLWISHSGVHEVSCVEIGKLHQLLSGELPADLAAMRDGNQPNVWVRIKETPARLSDLENDLTALYLAGIIHRYPTGGIGPRGIALSPDQSKLFVANYFSGTVGVLDTTTGQLQATIALGDSKEPDLARQGEVVFHDARLAFQRWLSCASCHPNDGRTDALRWDFMRDGIGNAKDTPSLILVRETSPLNRRATRQTVRECARTGVMVSHRIMPTDHEVDALTAYMNSLDPAVNPNLTVSGSLDEAAERGKELFFGRASCQHCHPGPTFTDRQSHNIATASAHEDDGLYDTPSLVELYRTAPYLHDGRAVTVKDVFRVHDPSGVHGKAEALSDSELDDLVAFLMSL
ncbi:beta-propeller fold lactonase family protein [Novipirellula artificiosorum]|uniref:Lactonase, 7-bladed beta-propeller n=1 Tax=Novipirellula artificiosorum TaxID=2528016 RepID=A0A5C6D6P0_9BACT|nr:beta-propeller fold lactonase family protein [Novipirellula artificiosorum]TWU32853.1 Lactonase, 7-bladed beta-propeller [Novipirellula artificiosorum]